MFAKVCEWEMPEKSQLYVFCLGLVFLKNGYKGTIKNFDFANSFSIKVIKTMFLNVHVQLHKYI